MDRQRRQRRATSRALPRAPRQGVRRALRSAVLVVGLAVAAAPPAAGDEPVGCPPPAPAVAAVLEEVRFELLHLTHDQSDRPCGQDECGRRAVERLAALLAEHPTDFQLQRAYLDLHRVVHGHDEEVVEPLRERYRELLRRHPESAVAHLLLARLEPRERAAELVDRAAQLAPGLGWTLLARIREAGADGPEAMARQVEAFAARCPGRPGEILLWALLVSRSGVRPSPELVAAVRPEVEAESWWRRARDLPLLWTLELDLADVAAHPALRQRVREEVDRLVADAPEGDFDVLMAVHRAAELTGDIELLRRSQADLLARYPCAGTVIDMEVQRLLERYPGTGEDDPATARERWDASRAVAERCPDNRHLAHQRFGALLALDDVEPVADDLLSAEATRLIAVTENRIGGIRYRNDSPHRRVARRFFERRLELARAAELLAREAELWESLYGAPPPADPPSLTRSYELFRLESAVLAARIEIARGRPETAAEHLVPVLAALPALREEDDPGIVPRAEALLAEHATARAELAAALGQPEPAATVPAPTTDADDAPHGWQPRDVVLPPLAVPDLEGRVWTWDDLGDRTAVVSFWATWCLPCVAELPYLARLAEVAADRGDLVVLSFNTDAERGLVAPFVARRKMPYPVLLATDYQRQLGTVVALPTSWIVGPGGRLRWELQGFGAEVAIEEWVATVVDLAERAARGESPP